MKSIVITGTSTGIGFDASRALVALGYRVYGSVRNSADAERVRAALGEACVPLLFDVTDGAGIAAAVEQVRPALGRENLVALVNNAGIAPTGPLAHQPFDEIRRIFEVNVFGLLAVTRAFLPLLGARHDAPHPRGRIVNISSLAGRLVFPLAGAYAASKHAVEALSDALRRELMQYSINVSAIEPGTIRTEIWDKFEASSVDKRYASTDYARAAAAMPGLVRSDVARGDPVGKVTAAICEAIEARHPRARYVLTKRWALPRWLPAHFLDREINKRMKLR